MNHPKIGFIADGGGGNPTGIGDYVRTLANAGIQPVVMCNDGDVGIADAISTGKPFVAVARVVKQSNEHFAVPDYNLPPDQAASNHWNLIKPHFHSTWVDHQDKIWIQPINEVDKNRAAWLGTFGIELAKLANNEGYKVAMFGWASGEPEAEHWRFPEMLAYLRYCQSKPNMAAVALHEYDLELVGMENTYPYHIGRFLELFKACDENGIARPKVLITEHGWQDTNVPAKAQVLKDIEFSARIYSKYHQILGAGLWYLGPGRGGIADKVQPLIAPVTNFVLNTSYEGTTAPPPAPSQPSAPSAPPQPVAPSTPPQVSTNGIDLTRFMIADRSCWRVVRMPDGRQEDIQDMPLGNGFYVRRKNTLGEWWKVDNRYFYLIHDTSPDRDSQGNERVYTLTKNGSVGAPKNPLVMRVGQTWQESGTHNVQFRAKNNGRTLTENSGSATNTAKLINHKVNYTFNTYGQNLTFDEVIWIETGQETQVYGRKDGKSAGWIGWSAPWGQSEPVELYWDRPAMAQEPDRYYSW